MNHPRTHQSVEVCRGVQENVFCASLMSVTESLDGVSDGDFPLAEAAAQIGLQTATAWVLTGRAFGFDNAEEKERVFKALTNYLGKAADKATKELQNDPAAFLKKYGEK